MTKLRTLTYLLLVFAGYALGATIGVPSAAEADITRGQPPKAFLSGGERSELVLKEIAAILARTEKRVANIEQSAQTMVKMQTK